MRPTSLKELVSIFLDIINTAIPVVISLTVVYFVWKLVDAWVLHADDERKVAEGKQVVLIGIIVFVVMIAVWSIVYFLRRSIFGF